MAGASEVTLPSMIFRLPVVASVTEKTTVIAGIHLRPVVQMAVGKGSIMNPMSLAVLELGMAFKVYVIGLH
jgi:hypothetical protein